MSLNKLNIVEAIRSADSPDQAIRILNNANRIMSLDSVACPSEDNDDGSESMEIYGCCCVKVTVGTNGFHGGDRGHGCKTFIEIEDEGGLSWSASVWPGAVRETEQPSKIRLEFYGDEELLTAIQCLELAAASLKDQALVRNTTPFAEQRERVKALKFL